MDNEPEYVDAKEAARILRVTEQTIRRETRSGKIPAVKIGREWRYLMDDLRQLTRQERPAAVKPAPVVALGVGAFVLAFPLSLATVGLGATSGGGSTAAACGAPGAATGVEAVNVN